MRSAISVRMLFMDRLFFLSFTSGLFYQVLENSVENSVIIIQKVYAEFWIYYCRCSFDGEEFIYFAEFSMYFPECTLRTIVFVLLIFCLLTFAAPVM